MTIFVVYEQEPNFPATDQQPNAIRFRVGDYWVDADAQPSINDIQSFISPPAVNDATLLSANFTQSQIQALQLLIKG